jgi:uncharacterized membrane protein
MHWLERRRLTEFLKTSMWVVPVVAMIAALILAPATRYLNDVFNLAFSKFGLQGARASMALIAGAMLSFVVFFFSVLLLTVQMASGNLSPRIIARPFRSTVVKVSLGLFVFTFVYATSVLGRLEEQVLQFPVFLTLVLCIASVATFLFVVENISKQLRPVTVVTNVAQEGLAVIQKTYPRKFEKTVATPSSDVADERNGYRSLHHQGRPGVIIAIDEMGLMHLAIRNDCVIELIPQVGDFVSTGIELLRVYGKSDDISDLRLNRSVAVGAERTMEQDPAFAFRIIVDVAEKALSSAINDPTTAVLAIDQIQVLLQAVGMRNLNTGRVMDVAGNVRLQYRTPDWEDFVLLGATEIRQYGATSIQVMRRLRAMLEELMGTLPAERIPALEMQLGLIHASNERQFTDRTDREWAEEPDSQGLGGQLRRKAPGDGC